MTSTFNKHKVIELSLLTILPSLFFFTLVEFDKTEFVFITIIPPIFILLLFLLAKLKGGFILAYILLSITFLENNPGIQIIEIPFYISTIILGGFVFFNVIRGNIKIENTLDKTIFLLHIILVYGLILGIVNGGNIYLAFGETSDFFGILLYFPLMKFMPNQKFTKHIIIVLLFILVFVLIRNLINYRQIILQAVMQWQAEKARVSSNEFILMFGALAFMSCASVIKRFIPKLFVISLFLLSFGGLILTQSRGYWISFFLGAAIIFLVINKNGKKTILITLLALSITGLFFIKLFLANEFQLILTGLQERFLTLTSGKLDVSLYERLLETKTVLGMMIKNPIAGYGLGYTYTKKIVFFHYFTETSYVHNGYLAMWLKFGLVGLLTLISFWFILIKKAIYIYKNSKSELVQFSCLTIVGTITGTMLVNNTSPQIFAFESLLFATIFASFLSTQLKKFQYEL